MIDSRISTTSRSTSAPPCKSTLISKIHPSLALRSYKSTGTASDTPSTPIAKWTDLGRSRFFRYGGQLQQPTPWLASYTPESPMNPKPTSDWTCDTHDTDDSSNSYRIEDLPVKLENPPPLASSTQSCQLLPHPPTKRPDTSQTWLSWGFTSAYAPTSTPSAPAIAG